MSEALKALNNIRTLRAQARETDLATLEEMLEKLTTIVEDRREEENSARKEQEERQAKLEAFRQKLLEDGIDLQNYSLQLVHPSLKPNQLVLLVLLNTNIQMKTVMSRLGRVRAVLLKQSPLLSKLVRHWKTLLSNRYSISGLHCSQDNRPGKYSIIHPRLSQSGRLLTTFRHQ